MEKQAGYFLHCGLSEKGAGSERLPALIGWWLELE